MCFKYGVPVHIMYMYSTVHYGALHKVYNFIWDYLQLHVYILNPAQKRATTWLARCSLHFVER